MGGGSDAGDVVDKALSPLVLTPFDIIIITTTITITITIIIMISADPICPFPSARADRAGQEERDREEEGEREGEEERNREGYLEGERAAER